MYMNEDLMWERLKDMQREAENSRLWAAAHPNPFRGIWQWVGRLSLARAEPAAPRSIPERDRDVA
jgi:hypothetical protein